MGKAIITNFGATNNTVRQNYVEAYRALRVFYAACRKGRYTEDQLMNHKLHLWFMYGDYLDLVWQHHFALKVAHATGKGWRNGWINMSRRYEWLQRTFAWEKANDIDGPLG